LVGRNVVGGQKRYPDGEGMVDNEILNVISVGGHNSNARDRVKIRPVEGLRLVVEKSATK
jgi:membrane-bound ClpP family serine protease